jgi:prepilin-type N-terminal cleavage/methylation domain-containing protein
MNVPRRRRSARLRRSSSGFTLIEVLLALAIASIIGGVIFALFRTSAATTGSLHASGRRLDRATAAMDLVCRDITCSVLLDVTGVVPFFLEPGGQGVDHCSSLALYCADKDEQGFGGIELCKIRYSLLEDDGGGGRTLVREKRVIQESGELAEPTELALADGIASFVVVAYDGTEWGNAWPRQNIAARLPQAAHISLSFVDGRNIRILESKAMVRAGYDLSNQGRAQGKTVP